MINFGLFHFLIFIPQGTYYARFSYQCWHLCKTMCFLLSIHHPLYVCSKLYILLGAFWFLGSYHFQLSECNRVYR
uniref:Uncharacterized protein n=1 Tax=Arundo donax TaxID=35708 RepID=A0A0A9E322_ARUDO